MNFRKTRFVGPLVRPQIMLLGRTTGARIFRPEMGEVGKVVKQLAWILARHILNLALSVASFVCSLGATKQKLIESRNQISSS